MNSILLVFAGAGLGGVLRHGVNLASARWSGSDFSSGFPWGTFSVNVVGSFAMGLLAGWLALKSGGWPQSVRLFLATGVLGGFTTFSAFSLDAMMLWERGRMLAALLYAGGSVAASIAALALGLFIIRSAA